MDKPISPLLIRKYSATETNPSVKDRRVSEDLILQTLETIRTTFQYRELGGATNQYTSYLFENGVVQTRDTGPGVRNPNIALYVDSSKGQKALDDLANEVGLPN